MQSDFYLWNVTNPDEIYQGAKPKLEEIGPFSYSISVSRRNVRFGNGTVGYTNFQNYQKINSTEPPLKITTINGPYLIIDQIQRHLPGWLQTLVRVFLKEQNYGPLVTKTADELIWGYQDPFLAFINKNLPGVISTSKFGFYINQNATDSGLFVADNGENGVENWMSIEAYDGKKSMKIWDSEYANMINGTDSYGFAPWQIDSTKLDFFVDMMCRSAAVSKITESVGSANYQLSFNTFASKNQFCVGGSCPLDGVHNLTKCTEIKFGHSFPVAITFPKLIGVDDYYTRQLVGVNFTEQDEYSTSLQIDKLTGLVYKGVKQMQLNLFYDSDVFYPFNVKQTLIPVMWFKQTAKMKSNFYRSTLFTAIAPLYTLYYLHFILMCLAALLFVVFGPIHFFCKHSYTELTEEPSHESENESNEDHSDVESSYRAE